MQDLQSVSANFPRDCVKSCTARAIKLRDQGERAKTVTAYSQPIPPVQDLPRVSKSLDEIDLKILAEIQADGRITNVELAKRVGISPPPCLRRVRTLEGAGYIQGYRGLLDPRRLGFCVVAFTYVHLSILSEGV